MATKPVNPDDPGQAQIFLTDLLLLRRGLSDFQVMVLMEAMQYEWQFGHAPAGEIIWRRLARPTNGQQRAELVELINEYDAHPLVAKLRTRRELALQSRRNKVDGASRRGEYKNPEAGTIENSTARQPLSEDSKANVFNTDALENTGESEASSSSASSSGNSGSGDTRAPAREDEPDPRQHPAVHIVFAAFGRVPPVEGQERIAAQVADLELWREVCDNWKTDYHHANAPPKVSKLLAIYHERLTRKQQGDLPNGTTTRDHRNKPTAAERNEQILKSRDYAAINAAQEARRGEGGTGTG